MESAGQHVGEGMMEFGYFELGLLLWGAFEAGKWYANQHTIRNMKELLDELGVPRDEQEKLKQTARVMRSPARLIELTKTNDILYAHDAQTGEFMGQDSNREELFKYIATRFGEGKYEVVDKTAE